MYLPYGQGADEKHFATSHPNKEHLALSGAHGGVNYLVTLHKNDSSGSDAWSAINAKGKAVIDEVL